MAQAGFTPILIYASGTATNIPAAGDLISGSSGAELAINYADGKLYYKDGSGSVKLLSIGYGSSSVTPTNGGVQYGTGTALALTAAGSSGQILRSNGAAAPTWADLSTLGVNTISFGTTGLTPNSATAGAVTVAGTLVTANGGTGLGGATPFTANGVLYASSASALTSGSALTFDGTNFATTGTASATKFIPTGGTATGNGMYLPTSNELAWSNNGSETMRLTSTGLGIGTSSPNQKLEVSGNIQVTATNKVIFNDGGGTDCFIGRSGAQTLVFGTANAERMRLDSSGNLGIGQTNPSSKLEVTGVVLSKAAGNAGRFDAQDTNSGGAIITINSALSSAGTPALQTQTNHPILFATNNTERARITSDGDFRITWTNGGFAGFYFDSTYYQGLTNGATNRELYIDSRSNDTGADIVFRTGLNTAVTERARITSGGDLLVGTTSVNKLGSGATASAFQLANSGTGTADTSEIYVYNAATATDRYVGAINFGTSGASASEKRGAIIGCQLSATSSTNVSASLNFFTNNAGTLAERARITSGGDFLVGTTSASLSGATRTLALVSSGFAAAFQTTSSTATDEVLCLQQSATTGDNTFIIFKTEGSTGTSRGSIDYNRAGGLTRYNTTSDYRAKDIIGPLTDSGAVIDALKVYEGVMKGATQARPMLIAHEAQAHAPYAVSGVKDEVNEDGTPKFQQMDVSSLVPLLLAEIQSLRQRVALLEGN